MGTRNRFSTVSFAQKPAFVLCPKITVGDLFESRSRAPNILPAKVRINPFAALFWSVPQVSRVPCRGR